MIQASTLLKVVDKTGITSVKCIKVLSTIKSRIAFVGDIIIGVVKSATPNQQVKKSDVVCCVIVRTKHAIRRPDGSVLRFDDNAAVVINKANQEPRGTRIFGPVARELRERDFMKIVSLAPEVL